MNIKQGEVNTKHPTSLRVTSQKEDLFSIFDLSKGLNRSLQLQCLPQCRIYQLSTSHTKEFGCLKHDNTYMIVQSLPLASSSFSCIQLSF